jgi:galactokinase
MMPQFQPEDSTALRQGPYVQPIFSTSHILYNESTHQVISPRFLRPSKDRSNFNAALGASEYNARRAECEQAVRLLAQVLPGIKALRDVTRTQLEEHSNLLSSNLYKRARHVITENERVLEAVDALETGAIGKLRQLMADSHRAFATIMR